MKIGRNEPCPCGSGKKYKKCCIDKERILSENSLDNSFGSNHSNDDNNIDLDIPPYVISKWIEPTSETAKEFAKKYKKLSKNSKNSWYPSKVRELSTPEIIKQLTSRKAPFNQDKFIEQCKKNRSAWDVAESLWPIRMNSSNKNVSDFIGLASCILWERLHSDGQLLKISEEMLDDMMQKGYSYMNEDNDVEAFETWLKVWDVLKKEYIRKDMSIEELDKEFRGSQSFYNWLSDIDMVFINSSIENVDCAKKGVVFFRELLNFFNREKEDHNMKNYTMTYAEMLCRSGQQSEGEEVLRAYIKKYPNEARGYVTMAMVIALRKEINQIKNKQDQLKILLEAKAYPVPDGDDYDLNSRIYDLEKDISQLSSNALLTQ